MRRHLFFNPIWTASETDNTVNTLPDNTSHKFRTNSGKINPFPYSSDNKRYHTLNYYLKNKYGGRVAKASLDAGFSCPNIDGTCGTGGCTYCTSGASEFTSPGGITAQLTLERERIFKKYGEVPLIAYFQAHTNTYAPLDVLKEKYEEALNFPGVCAVSIATRADCLEEDKLRYLGELSRRTDLTVELGLQTVSDRVAKRFNRGYNFDVFKTSYERLKAAGIRTCVHLINGLYGETFEDMLLSAKTIGEMQPDGIKIHLLHIMKNTAMEQEYLRGEILPMEYESYIKTVCSQLRYIPQSCVIERITGDGSRENLIAPRWSIDKIRVLGGIDKYMAENNIFQGDLL